MGLCLLFIRAFVKKEHGHPKGKCETDSHICVACMFTQTTSIVLILRQSAGDPRTNLGLLTWILDYKTIGRWGWCLGLPGPVRRSSAKIFFWSPPWSWMMPLWGIYSCREQRQSLAELRRPSFCFPLYSILFNSALFLMMAWSRCRKSHTHVAYQSDKLR